MGKATELIEKETVGFLVPPNGHGKHSTKLGPSMIITSITCTLTGYKEGEMAKLSSVWINLHQPSYSYCCIKYK